MFDNLESKNVIQVIKNDGFIFAQGLVVSNLQRQPGRSVADLRRSLGTGRRLRAPSLRHPVSSVDGPRGQLATASWLGTPAQLHR